MVKSSELQTHSDAVTGRNFNNLKQRARTSGSLPKATTFSSNLPQRVSPAEHEYDSCQRSPSSDVSFGWQEVPTHTAPRCSFDEGEDVRSSSSFASECTDSNEELDVTADDRHLNESVEGKEKKKFGATATNKENFREDKERAAKSTHLGLKRVVSENFGGRSFRLDKTRESVSEVNSEELSDLQKLAKDHCKKKKTHDIPMREDSGSDSSDDSVEVRNKWNKGTSESEFVFCAVVRSNMKHLLTIIHSSKSDTIGRTS
jgi:hypothetical protein